MKTRLESVSNVEPEDLESRVAEFADDGGRDITVKRQPDGLYSVSAIVPADEGAK